MKRKRIGGGWGYVDETGKVISKECKRCKQVKKLEEYGKSKKYLAKRTDICIDCIFDEIKLIKEEYAQTIKDVLKTTPNRKFTPKYSYGGRRVLIAYELEHFKELALKGGYKEVIKHFDFTKTNYQIYMANVLTKDEFYKVKEIDRKNGNNLNLHSETDINIINKYYAKYPEERENFR